MVIPVFTWLRFARFLFSLQCFIDHWSFFMPIHVLYTVCPSTYVFWLPLWYLQTFFLHLNNYEYIIICVLVFNFLLKLLHFRVFGITDIFLDCDIKRQSINQCSATNKIVLYDANLEGVMLLECSAYLINVSFASDFIKVLIIHFYVLCIIYSTL